MVAIYLVIAVMAIVITALFVDQLPDDKATMGKRPTTKEVGDNFLATIKHMRHTSQLLLIPITMFSGFEQSFYGAEFTKVTNLGLVKSFFHSLDGASDQFF